MASDILHVSKCNYRRGGIAKIGRTGSIALRVLEEDDNEVTQINVIVVQRLQWIYRGFD